jgi:glycosyltransferase involved in cell wall biosynthesis
MNSFQEKTYLPQNQRKKILLLSDDFRMPSGVGTMSKEIVFGTCQHYNWFQVGAAIDHPDAGKLLDLSADVTKHTGIPDPYVRLLPNTGYGNPTLLRQIIMQEKVDAILHFTDPRQWIWLYQMSPELRQRIPILFYHVWDDLPYPMYNATYYESCDWIACISKQTYNIVKNTYINEPLKDQQVDYIPHGINDSEFFPIEENTPSMEKLMEIKKIMFGESNPKFVVLYNSRNIRRKLPGNIILAFSKFVDSFPKEQQNDIVMIMHTQPVDMNGTDLPEVVKSLAPGKRILFSSNRISAMELNCLYNIADVTINLSNAEGFGLGTAESLMAGTPIIVNVTGGLQDQCRFEDENGDWLNLTSEYPSNHKGKYTKCGAWAFPVFPKVLSLTGSPPTPYIYEDFADWEDATIKLHETYELGREKLKEIGKLGREWLRSDESGMSTIKMSEKFINGIDKSITNFTPLKKYNLYKISGE